MNIRDHAYLRTAGAVKRMHTIRMQPQSLADHSWGVAMLVLTCSPSLPSSHLLAMALLHDLPEFRTGDIPATAKWDYPKLEAELKVIEAEWFGEFNIQYQLTPEERTLLKWCDRAELAWRCIEELYGGNQYALEILHNILSALGECPNRRCEEMLVYMEQQASTSLGTKFYSRRQL